MTGDSVLEISNELLLALERKKILITSLMEGYPSAALKFTRKTKADLTAELINTGWSSFQQTSYLQNEKKKKKKVEGKEKNKREKQEKKPKKSKQVRMMYDKCKMEVTENNRPSASFIHFWCKQTDKIKSLSFARKEQNNLLWAIATPGGCVSV